MRRARLFFLPRRCLTAGRENVWHDAPGSVAIDLREVSDQGAEYPGRYLAKATYDAATKVGVEIAAAQVAKTARIARNRTPFDLLADLAASVDAQGFGVRTARHWAVREGGYGDWAVVDLDAGEATEVTPPGEWAVWHEWEQASKGCRLILWSQKRRDPQSAGEELWNSLLAARGELPSSLMGRSRHGEQMARSCGRRLGTTGAELSYGAQSF